MTLLEYIKFEGFGPYSSKIAERFGVGRQHLGDIATGKKRPSPDLAFRIEEMTEGRVSARKLLIPSNGEEKEAA